MSDEDRSSRTEEATESKLREAVEKGNTPVSREMAIFVALLGMLAITTFVLPRMTSTFVASLAGLFDRAARIRLDNATDGVGIIGTLAVNASLFLAPLLAILGVGGIAASVVQSPFQFATDRLKPKASRLSPRRNLERLVGVSGFVEFGRSLAKVVGLGAIAVFVLRADTPAMLDAMHADPSLLPGRVLAVAAHLLTGLALAMGLIVIADVAWTRHRWRADLRMTRHEIKEERKQSEGDPLVKARLRSIALDRARRRMMTNVPRATMIVTNPTHFAVALRYVRSEGGAPLVVAKGQDLIALRIRELAREHGIPIVENKPLARALYDQVAVDRMIPPDFYRAVAEILNMLTRRRSAFAT